MIRITASSTEKRDLLGYLGVPRKVSVASLINTQNKLSKYQRIEMFAPVFLVVVQKIHRLKPTTS